jgi:transcriptional regulator with XRE-family HTH domain
MVMNLATKVKELRKVKGLSIIELAKLVPMERSYLWQIEKGKYANLSLLKLQGLATALDVSLDYLTSTSVETRSWEKVAADESLELFLKKHDISEEDKIRLRAVSFKESTPRTLTGWEQLWNNMTAFHGLKYPSHSLRNRPRTRKNFNLDSSPAEFPSTDVNQT